MYSTKYEKILLIFTALYLEPSFSFLLRGTYPSYHTHFFTPSFLYSTSFNLIIFISSFLVFIPEWHGIRVLRLSRKMCVFLIALTILLIYYGLPGNNIFENLAYINSGNRNAYFEYALIPITILLYAVNVKLFIKLPLVISYVFLDLIYGGRIASIMVILMIIILHWEHVRNSHKLVIGFCTILILKFLAFARANVTQFLSLDFKLSEVLYSKSKIAMSHQGDVIAASLRVRGLVSNDLVDSLDVSLYIFSIILWPFNNFIGGIDVTRHLVRKYTTGGGGLVSEVVYTNMGLFGLIVFGIVASGAIRWITANSSNKGYAIYMVFALVPRWLAYSFLTLTKLWLISVVFLTALVILDKYVFYRNNTHI